MRVKSEKIKKIFNSIDEVINNVEAKYNVFVSSDKLENHPQLDVMYYVVHLNSYQVSSDENIDQEMENVFDYIMNKLNSFVPGYLDVSLYETEGTGAYIEIQVPTYEKE